MKKNNTYLDKSLESAYFCYLIPAMYFAGNR